MNEITLSDDLNIITAEINSYKQVAGQAIFEIGKRLKHVKENDLVHGEWTNYCEKTLDMTIGYANRYIRVFEEFGDSNMYTSIGLNKLYQIATLPEGEREKEHQVNGEKKTVAQMTSRELESLKRQLRAEQKERERLENENQKLANQEPKVIERVVEDETRINELEGQIKHLEGLIRTEQQDAETYRKLRQDIDRLRSRKDDVIRQIDNASSIGKFIARVERSFEEDLAPVKYSRAIEELERSEVVQESLDKIVSKVEDWCQEIRGLMKDKNVVEVIDHE